MSDVIETLDQIRGIAGKPIQATQSSLENFPETVRTNGGLGEWIASMKGVDLCVPWSAEDLTLCRTPQSIAQVQTGYSVDAQGKLLPGWHPSWFVIGHLSGDPIVAKTDDAACSVLFARHGTGTWNPQELAATPAQFAKSIKTWCDLFVIEFSKKIYNDDFSVRADILERLRQSLDLVLSEPQKKTFVRMVDG